MNKQHLKNHQAFCSLSDAEKSAHQGEYALFSEGVLVAYCKTNKEAISEACKLGLHGRFSIIQVKTYPEDIGFNGILWERLRK